MRLYLLEQSDSTGYDTYDSCVVAATSQSAAKKIHPSGDQDKWGKYSRTWARSHKSVTATLLGTATRGTKQGVICASFKAG